MIQAENPPTAEPSAGQGFNGSGGPGPESNRGPPELVVELYSVAVTVCLILAEVVTSALLGTWAYYESRAAIFGQLVQNLGTIDHLAEREVESDIRLNLSRLSNIADPALVKLAAENPEAARGLLGLIAPDLHTNATA